MDEEGTHHSVKKEYKITYVDRVRDNPWIIATGVLAILLVVMLIITASGGFCGSVSEKVAGENLLAFMKSQGQTSASIVSTEKQGNMYMVTVSYQGQSLPVYITLDGKTLFLNKIPLAIKEEPAAPSPTATAEVPKAVKPAVELYVMSFCPYGVKAENNILPVIELLKDSIDFKVRFIVQVSGSTIDTVSSLHGINEAKEDARQLIIMRDYPTKFYTYLKQFNSGCYPLASDAAKLETCWKNVAAGLGMDTAKIETAAYGSEGIALLKAEEVKSSANGVSGSPTLIINGAKSQSIYGGTAPTQTAICSAFNTAPSACGTQATAPAGSSAPAGSCG